MVNIFVTESRILSSGNWVTSATLLYVTAHISDYLCSSSLIFSWPLLVLLQPQICLMINLVYYTIFHINFNLLFWVLLGLINQVMLLKAKLL